MNNENKGHDMIKVAVTTSKEDTVLIEQAEQIALELNIEYLSRRRRSIDTLRNEYDLDYLLIIESQQVILKGETTLAWHPCMAVPRIKFLRLGQKDPMIEAMGLKPDYTVLDCTLGLGADALVASYFLGEAGSVIGLEASKYIAFLTKWGLNNFSGRNKHVISALSRITVLNQNYLDYLPEQADNKFDVVYLDPMFECALKKSSGLNALRPLAFYGDVTCAVIKEAKRVAKRRVVMKQNIGSTKANKLKPDFIGGGRYSPVTYYIWEKNE
ncbi:MAG: protein-L-IsoD [Firmicutes bacterium HGW-Firmicutes-12]|jgi:hypothetical protein|nr:MAG: protein-L-IsoD [Firmicutes bacterium HGW-Firmicutes-12]